ncbi:MAG: hypothetical protein PVSMB7_30200 [Chloroflexota bacterium]
MSALHNEGIIDAVAYQQIPVFEAAVMFTRVEGILPAPESAHAVRAAVDLACECREHDRKQVILFNLSGHGHFDLGAYDAFFGGELENYELQQEQIDTALEELPVL